MQPCIQLKAGKNICLFTESIFIIKSGWQLKLYFIYFFKLSSGKYVMTHTSIKENRDQHKVKGNQVIPKKMTNSNIIGLMIFT